MSAPPENPQEAAPEQLRQLQSELEETARWMRQAVELTGRNPHESDAELREACEKIIAALLVRRSPLDAALENILEARRHAISAGVGHIVENAYKFRNEVGKGFLQERFPGGQYGKFFRLTEDAAERVRAARNSARMRAELFSWARENLSALREMFGQLRASEAAIVDAKNKRNWTEKRDKFRFRAEMILIAVLAVVGWLVAALLAWF